MSDTYEFHFAVLKSNQQVTHDLKDIWNNLSGPTILEVIVNKDVESFPKLFPKMNEDGSISSGSFIDCHPEKSDWYEKLNSRIQAL